MPHMIIGTSSTSQQIGGALGLAILSAVATAQTSDVMEAARGDRAQLPAALTEGFQSAFLLGAGFALLGAFLALVMISGRDSKAHVEAVQSGEAEPVPIAA